MAITTVTALVCILGVVFVTSFQVVSPSSVEHRTRRVLVKPPILSSVPDLSYVNPDFVKLQEKLFEFTYYSEKLSQSSRLCESLFGFGSIVFCLCCCSVFFIHAAGMVLTVVCRLWYKAQSSEQENPPLCANCSSLGSITKENGEIILVSPTPNIVETIQQSAGEEHQCHHLARRNESADPAGTESAEAGTNIFPGADFWSSSTADRLMDVNDNDGSSGDGSRGVAPTADPLFDVNDSDGSCDDDSRRVATTADPLFDVNDSDGSSGDGSWGVASTVDPLFDVNVSDGNSSDGSRGVASTADVNDSDGSCAHSSRNWEKSNYPRRDGGDSNCSVGNRPRNDAEPAFVQGDSDTDSSSGNNSRGVSKFSFCPGDSDSSSESDGSGRVLAKPNFFPFCKRDIVTLLNYVFSDTVIIRKMPIVRHCAFNVDSWKRREQNHGRGDDAGIRDNYFRARSLHDWS